MAPYPTEAEIAEIVRPLSTPDREPFYKHVSSNVIWDFLGSPSARFNGSVQLANVLARLDRRIRPLHDPRQGLFPNMASHMS